MFVYFKRIHEFNFRKTSINKFEKNKDDRSALVYLNHYLVKDNRILGINELNSEDLYSIAIFSMLMFQPQKSYILPRKDSRFFQ